MEPLPGGMPSTGWKPVLPKPVLPKPVLPKPVLPKPVLPKPVLPKPVLPKPVLLADDYSINFFNFSFPILEISSSIISVSPISFIMFLVPIN